MKQEVMKQRAINIIESWLTAAIQSPDTTLSVRKCAELVYEEIAYNRIANLDALGEDVCSACTGISICDSTETDKYYIRKEGHLFWTGPEDNDWVGEFDDGAWEAETMDEAQRVFTANCPACQEEDRRQ